MTMMSDLPGDLFEEILGRVPAISLKRLRSSCKRWNRLFNDKEFAGKHLHKAPKQTFFSCPIDGEFIIISEVFHCNDLLLYTFNNKTRIMLWNPFTGQTSWGIQPFSTSHTYALGSCQEIHCCGCPKDDSVHELTIYEIDSNSWRILDVIQDFRLLYIGKYVSLKEKTYWLGRLILPFNCPLDCFRNAALSVVSEEKLAVLLLRKNTWEKEIWISNKIDGTKEVSWRKFLKMDYPKRDNWISISRFLVDEEKKVALCYEICVLDRFTTMMKKLIYIYVPSLVQIPPSGSKK
ncbi:hypothetical protein N665_2013s0002 [Sinapis alba]|nr:hypothetical protein N665_2013s0002 [Sinapis alba]